jgi:hypothetical protein
MNISTRFALCLALCAGVAFTAPMASAQEALRPVGQLSYVPEPVELQTGVISLRPEDRMIRAMRLEARGGSVDIQSVRLIYRDGQSERIRVRERLRPGGMTALIRKQGRGPLREVEVNYIPQGAVTLVLRAGAGLPPLPPPPPPVAWTELGCKTVNFLIDRDVMNVSAQDLYRALRLRSTGFDIEMIELGVRFANGQKDTYRINGVIRAGERATPIDLRGERRRIVALELLYRTPVLSTMKTRLCVDGLQVQRMDQQDEDDLQEQ